MNLEDQMIGRFSIISELGEGGMTTNNEYAISGSVQNFANGFIMQTSSGHTNTYYYDSSWR